LARGSSPDKPLPAALSEMIMDAHELLRAFEDAHLGKDAPRPDGGIERGYGSRFAKMEPAKKSEHAALERLVKAEQGMTEAKAAMAKAHLEHAAASAHVAHFNPELAAAESEDVADAVGDE
jgi:hypothetical protein